MPSDGRYVTCHAWAPKTESQPHTVSRVHCLMQTREFCPRCPNSQFILRLTVGVGHQTVLCPQWQEKGSRGSPNTYVPTRRELCLTQRPFDFCLECPNGRAEEAPRSTDGWYDDPELRRCQSE